MSLVEEARWFFLVVRKKEGVFWDGEMKQVFLKEPSKEGGAEE